MHRRVGKAGPQTLEVTEYESPVPGPRRMRLDKNGISNNPIPPPVLEGRVLEALCIDPAYDPKTEAAAVLGQN